MVNQMFYRRANGGALAMTLLAIAMMVTLILALNKLALSHQRSAANYGDYELAQNAARMALLNAEATIYSFDITSNMEALTIQQRINAVLALAGSNNACGGTGWCYSTDLTWQPWLQTSSSNNLPCNSYSVSINPNDSNALPWIDQATGNFNTFNTGLTLCAQPRYIMELVNPSYTGRQVLGQQHGQLTQINGATIRMYDNDAGGRAARLYRITVRAFGRNGNTRVTLQEYVAIVGPVLSTATDVRMRIIPISLRWLRDD